MKLLLVQKLPCAGATVPCFVHNKVSFISRKMAAGNLVKEASSPTICYYGPQCPLQQSVQLNSSKLSVTKYRIARHVDACVHKRPPLQLAAVEI